MTSRILCQKLAIERCIHNLAQLCALRVLSPPSETSLDLYDRTFQDLVGCLNRDLGLINEAIHQDMHLGGEEDPYKEAEISPAAMANAGEWR
jgi:hypothetical protein